MLAGYVNFVGEDSCYWFKVKYIILYQVSEKDNSTPIQQIIAFVYFNLIFS